MNGPQHYAEAERLIDRARGQFGDHYDDVPAVAARLAEAQVHATLALVAATVAERVTAPANSPDVLLSAPTDDWSVTA